MHLNHLNLPVSDLETAAEFFVRQFDFSVLDRKGRALIVLEGDDGFSLVLSDPAKFGGPPPGYHGAFHLGFQVASPTAVDDAHRRLLEAGHATDREPGASHGAYGFYFTPFDDLVVEVTTAS